jgi:hypothetical protein
MQSGGDLEHAWIMSDHIKRVAKWTTMACHLWEPENSNKYGLASVPGYNPDSTL